MQIARGDALAHLPAPVTPIRAILSSILLAQRAALQRIEAIKATNRDPDAWYMPVHEDDEFRAELNEGVGFYLDIYSSSEEVISLLHKWPFDDATKGVIPSKRLPYVDLILEFDRLNEKLHKLGQASMGYHVKYHYIPKIENRAVEVVVIEELDRYGAKLEKILNGVVNDVEKEKESERQESPVLKTTPILKTIPISKPGGKSTRIPKSVKTGANLREKRKGKEIAKDDDEIEIDEEMEEPPIPKTTPISTSGVKSTPTPKSTKMEANLREKRKRKGKEMAREDDETEMDEEIQEPPISKTMPISKPGGKPIPAPKPKSGGKSTPTPKTTAGGKSIPTPQSTPVQKPKLKLKLISRDPRVRQNSTPKAPEG
ncbi:uncharacterized protein EAF02_005085 [Botrytis sinoallii]|uniref:uncharacterized protein n=1 Tax=Botrytis sinoallii TaxID=1463999 RepID=UPI0018FFD949|nr:uncharacterized protein EAF02_005085 [Botrytis sinoallii]KAF7884749.1 hypothetical protein EAF02_005085 [Botrytis sinoallii]